MIISWSAQLGPEAVLYQHKGHVLVSKIADIFELINNHNYKTIPTNSYDSDDSYATGPFTKSPPL